MNMDKRNSRRLTQKESGMVSIIVTMIISIVLSLIVMGFSQLSRREQRQALDRQLSTQAYYAAESGINDVIKKYKDNPAGFVDKSTCDTSGYPNGGVLDASLKIAYTCVLAKSKVPDLTFEPLISGTIIPISNIDLTSIEISWDGGNNTTFNAAQYPQLYPNSTWEGDTDVLEITITPRASLSRADLIAKSFTAFLYPQDEASSGTNPIYPDYTNIMHQGPVLKGKCNSENIPKYCKINFLSLPGSNTKGYIIRLKTLYNKPTNVKISGKNGDGPVDLTGSQLLIDVTGKANDVLRRVQVRYPISSTQDEIPLSVVESAGSMCKQIKVAPLDVVNDVFKDKCPSFDY